MKHLKVGDQVIAIFLGSPEPCEVIEVTDKKKKLYKLRMKSGTILPSVTWFKLLDAKERKNKPWHILKYVEHIKPKVIEDDKVKRADLDQAIDQQRKFIRGEIKE
jgi:hypothetical protein